MLTSIIKKCDKFNYIVIELVNQRCLNGNYTTPKVLLLS